METRWQSGSFAWCVKITQGKKSLFFLKTSLNEKIPAGITTFTVPAESAAFK
jgi:hypothetical protein